MKKIDKQVRELFKLSFVNGKIDSARVKIILGQVGQDKSGLKLPLLRGYKKLLENAFKQNLAVVESAVELKAADKGKVEKTISEKFSGGLKFEYKVNPNLLGGIKVSVGDNQIDVSLATLYESLIYKV